MYFFDMTISVGIGYYTNINVNKYLLRRHFQSYKYTKRETSVGAMFLLINKEKYESLPKMLS